jgi:L-arabinokinase
MSEDWPGLDELKQILGAPRANARLSEHWDAHARETIVTRAPARLDVMGGIADYSGSLVLQLPLREATFVALQPDRSRRLTIVSLDERRSDGDSVFTMPLSDFLVSGARMPYEDAREYFRREPPRAWAAYVAGSFLVLMREKELAIDSGARLFVHSRVPEGKGVASSAALEVAAMTAIDAAYGLGLAPREIALLCQKVENLVVGAPCGVMDQMSSVFGEADRLMVLRCQPAEREPSIAVPEALSFWGIDSGIAHAVSGADYTSVRTGAFMGLRLLQDVEEEHSGWGGYLSNLAPSDLEQRFLDRLPESMLGADFIERYGTTSDTVTRVDPKVRYPILRPTAHPIYENFRIGVFARLLREGDLEDASLLGELMYQSHASYSGCGLGSEGTDRLVALAREAGPANGIYGAKITGGGSGGTVAILGRRDAAPAVRAIARCYSEETGKGPIVFAGSSPGAARFSPLRL